jgi:L-lysine exporter family protein LysE/ArgO
MNIFFTGFMLSLSLCLDIGIGNVAIINVTIKHVARRGYWFGFGAIVGDLIYAALSILGMGLLLQFEVVQYAAVGGSLIAQATNGSLASSPVFLAGFFAGGISWCVFLITMTAQSQKIMGKSFIRGCHIVSALLYIYFAAIVFMAGMKKFEF